MSQAISKIKSRIKSVTGAYKVTSAMKLVSNVKLKQWRNKMLANKEYIDLSKETLETILLAAKNNQSSFLNANEGVNKKLFIIVSSTLGLCGSYNANIFKLADSKLSKEDDAIIIGGKGVAHYRDGGFTKLEGFEISSSLQDKIFVNKIANFVLEEYQNNKYSEIHLIYSEYKNSMVFLAKDMLILPLKKEVIDTNEYLPIMEPSPKELVDKLIPIYIKSLIFSKLLESSVCEEASRSNAMENATNNAQDILEELKIEFNKARQGAITQEIVEVVSASKSV